MIELEVVKILIELGSFLPSLGNYFSKSKRKKEISQWLYELGSNIENLAHHFENNQYPSGVCERMRISYDNLNRIVGDAITNKDEEKIKELIGSCIEIEKTYYEYIKLDEFNKTDTVQELFSIAGDILGMADILKYEK